MEFTRLACWEREEVVGAGRDRAGADAARRAKKVSQGACGRGHCTGHLRAEPAHASRGGDVRVGAGGLGPRHTISPTVLGRLLKISHWFPTSFPVNTDNLKMKSANRVGFRSVGI